MSSSIFLKNPPADWCNVYFNSVTADEITSDGTGTFPVITSGTGTFDTVIADTGTFTTVTANEGIFLGVQGNTGSFNYIRPIAPQTYIEYNGNSRFTGDVTAPLPMYSFTSFVTQTPGTSTMYIADLTSGFAQPDASILLLEAPSSVTLAPGTNFIICKNASATGGPYSNEIVFNVASNGACGALSFDVWSSVDYKKNIVPVHIDSRKLKNIEPATYQYISDHEDKKRIGIMWEDIEKLHPHACCYDRKEIRKHELHISEKEEVCEKCNSYFKCDNCEDDEVIEIVKENKKVDLSGAIGVLFSVIKDLEDRISKLENNCIQYIK